MSDLAPEIKEQGDIWSEMPEMKDAESCIGAGLTWAIKSARPKTIIPPDIESQINAAKLGKCKYNIPLSYILGTAALFPDVVLDVYAQDPYYLGELKRFIPKELRQRVIASQGEISVKAIKAGKLGICAVMVDKGALEGGFSIAHTVVVNPSDAGNKGSDIVYSDPWSGFKNESCRDEVFENAIAGLRDNVHWGNIAISARQ